MIHTLVVGWAALVLLSVLVTSIKMSYKATTGKFALVTISSAWFIILLIAYGLGSLVEKYYL